MGQPGEVFYAGFIRKHATANQDRIIQLRSKPSDISLPHTIVVVDVRAVGCGVLLDVGVILDQCNILI